MDPYNLNSIEPLSNPYYRELRVALKGALSGHMDP